jgi:hypothetical protein
MRFLAVILTPPSRNHPQMTQITQIDVATAPGAGRLPAGLMQRTGLRRATCRCAGTAMRRTAHGILQIKQHKHNNNDKRGFSVPRPHRKLQQLALLLLCACLPVLPALPTYAQPAASFTSSTAVVAPLEPTVVNINIDGYSGDADLVIFDSRGRTTGAFRTTLAAGYGAALVTPRGALGDHWAALFTADGRQVASGTVYRLDAQTGIQTGTAVFDRLYDRVRAFMANKRLAYELDGGIVAGYRSPDSPLLWLRDHYYQNRAFRYFETDLTSLPAANTRAQSADGSLPDFLARPEWDIPAFRTPVEADVEYLFVQLIYETWQTSGDTAWMLAQLPAAQRAVAYSLSDPLRWEPTLGLVKRPFTIDTWDFEYGPTTTDPNTGQPAPRHWIDEQTKWGIFHGDNTGLAQALRSLAVMEEQAGLWESAYERRVLADQIMTRLNTLSWNGDFYTHHVKLVPFDVPGVDEARQLSLSNAIALNRAVLTPEQGRAIVGEYLRRLQDPNRVAFAEWWSIDPPFPPGAFGLAGRLGERPGEYVNGGIMPLVGGELSRGAFRYGYEAYGFDILERYVDLINRTGSTYLWYYPTGGVAPAQEFLPTDGWGSSAMLGALIEGAAGIEDQGITFSSVSISPRWPASPRTNVDSAAVTARYAASEGYAAYQWRRIAPDGRTPGRLELEATGSGDQFRLRLLLPDEVRDITGVNLNGPTGCATDRDDRRQPLRRARCDWADCTGTGALLGIVVCKIVPAMPAQSYKQPYPTLGKPASAIATSSAEYS